MLGLHHVQITVGDKQVQAARDFYCGLLQLPEIPKPASLASRGGFWVQLGHQQLHVSVEEGVDRTLTKAHVAYQVADLAIMKARLTGVGLRIGDSVPIPGCNRFESRDPFGNRIEFSCSLPPSPARRPVSLSVDNLSFAYPGTGRPVLEDVSLRLSAGDRCLLVGANGAGKSTLLHVLAGHHLVFRGRVQLLGGAPFQDVRLAKDLAYIGGRFDFTADVPVSLLLQRLTDLHSERCGALRELLSIDPDWRMHTVSDGQRRRVQLLLALTPPRRVLLLDEATSDLDVIARKRLLEFLTRDADSGTVLLYATHIFDGLDDWATHILHLEEGRRARFLPMQEVSRPLAATMVRWLGGAAESRRSAAAPPTSPATQSP